MSLIRLNSFAKYAANLDLLTQAGLHRAQKKPGERRDTTGDEKTKNLDSAYQEWQKQPTPETMGRVLEHAEPLIQSSLTSYAGGHDANLHGKARMLAVQAVKSYQPNNQTKLRTWMMTNMQGLRRYAGQASPITAPERVRTDHLKLQAAATEHRDSTGEEPSTTDLAERTRLSPKRVAYVQQMLRPVVAEGQMTGPDGRENPDLYIPSAPEDGALNTWAEYVYHDLPAVDRRIYDMVKGRNGFGPTSTNHIAAKLGVSAGAISQRITLIDQRINEGRQLDGKL